MPLIQLPISEEIDKEISSVSPDKNAFILEAVKQKLKQAKLDNIQEQLIEGYKKNHSENLLLNKEFTSIDLENWDEY
jgi:hypothetical protein